MLQGFEPIKISVSTTSPSMTITKNGVNFTKSVVEGLGKPEYVVILVDAQGKRVALQACRNDNPDATPFFRPGKDKYGVRWNNRDLLGTFSNMMGWGMDGIGYRVPGKYISSEHAVIFDLNTAATFSTK